MSKPKIVIALANARRNHTLCSKCSPPKQVLIGTLYYIKGKDAEKGPYVKSQLRALWEKTEIISRCLLLLKRDGWKPLMEMMEEERDNTNASVSGLLTSPLSAVLPTNPVTLCRPP